MEKPPTEHEKLLRDIDRLLTEAPDEASRRDLKRLKESVNSPEMLAMARDLETHRPRQRGTLALEFHDPLLPSWLTATFSVIATAVCLYAAVLGFQTPVATVSGTVVNLWAVAAFAGALSVTFTALSFQRSFSVRFDTEGMTSRVSGKRWQKLHVGAMSWKDIRAIHERTDDRLLEVRSAGGAVFEIPMRVANYPVLQQHLENMVRLYGDPGAS